METASYEITFRHDAREGDSELIRQMVAGTGFFSEAEVAIAQELIDARLDKGAASGYSFLFAGQGRDTLGYACYGEIPCTVGSYDLYWIVVDRKYQNQGVGKRLLTGVETEIGKLTGRAVYVETSGREIYQPTRAFYLRSGYREIALFPDFYGPSDAKHVYVKYLTPGR